MKNYRSSSVLQKSWYLLVIALSFFQSSFAQPESDPHSISATVTQNIHFGSFCLTGQSGGTITVALDGSRTSTGGIVLLSNAPMATPAIYEIRLNQARHINLTYNPTSTLKNSRNSKLVMNIGPSDQGANSISFAAGEDDHSTTIVRVGGTLHIPGTSTPGVYSSNFDITFN